jgi:predicted TIM-barrel fold metal-dependent hydrolase
MAKKHDLPIWVHPTRTAKFADYASEQSSKYEIWWLFGWPYETSAFMARMVFSQMFERLPKLRFITHHLGAMAPFFVNRIGYGMDQFGSRTADEDYESLLKKMKKRPLEYFKMFYGDTSVNGSASAIRCGLDFFGVERVLFGTDCPFDPEGGPLFIRETIKTLERMALKPGDRRKIYFGNALNLLRLSESKSKPKPKAKQAKRKPAKRSASSRR